LTSGIVEIRALTLMIAMANHPDDAGEVITQLLQEPNATCWQRGRSCQNLCC
jgi:hypothetical protein